MAAMKLSLQTGRVECGGIFSFALTQQQPSFCKRGLGAGREASCELQPRRESLPSAGKSMKQSPDSLSTLLLTDKSKLLAPVLSSRSWSRSRSRWGREASPCVALLDDVPHLSDFISDLPEYRNPLQDNPAYGSVEQYFVSDNDVVIRDVVVKEGYDPSQAVHFRRAGPRERILFKPDEVRACVVTCGGLCPGLNTVIREVVCSLWLQYGVREIYGIDGGYRGFYARNIVTLNPKVVNDIHKRGGTILHTSRGGHETSKIVNAIEDRGINQVYIIGGDGTQRGADLVHKEIMRRGLKVAVAGIPKTIDNDIAVIDRSFGFDTAVEEAQRAINAAHVEAESVENGLGLVKLMGRYSGYIAMYATLASRDVDCCLIPEVPFYLEGPGGLYDYIQKRLHENGHMVLVVAEGAGQDLVAKTVGEASGRDKSGNRLLQDVGLWLSHHIKDHFTQKRMEMNLKYIDPTYMIRAIPSNASDNVYCTLLAHSAIHGAMAGYTGFIVGPVNGRHAYIPIARVTETTNAVKLSDRMWARVLSSTQQPSFLTEAEITQKREPVGAATGGGNGGAVSRPLAALAPKSSSPVPLDVAPPSPSQPVKSLSPPKDDADANTSSRRAGS